MTRLPSALLRAALAFAVLLPAPALAETILFVGNSYTFGAASPAWKYRADTVTDLNNEGIGGVPALFKAFTEQRGLDYQVALETAGGKGLRWHWENRAQRLDRAWDHVVLQEWSSLNKTRSGSPDYPAFTRRFADMFAARNPKVRMHLTAIWPRPDQIYPATGAWHGTPIAAQALAFRAEADRAAAQPGIAGVLPVGQAFLRAIGYYLKALIVFGRVTGQDPRTLGRDEAAGQDLGLSRDQAERLQRIAFETLAAG
jgi:hypothetical protein